MNPTDAKREARFMQAMAESTRWYAACQHGHPIWFSPETESYEQALADARSHDKSRHDGTETAVVLDI